MAGKSRSMTAADRFWSKVSVSDIDRCWEWTASKYLNGYGHFRLRGPQISAHRAAWILTFGEIPEGLHVCHQCDNRGCVNPAHLWLGTIKQNYDDMVAKGRRVSGHALKTHCLRGHEFTPENTFNYNAKRICRMCRNESRRKK